MAAIDRSGRQTLRTKSGELITDEDVDALAAEAEAGYDLSQARWERVGRPSLDEGISPRLSFRASRKLYEAIRTRAAQEGRTISDLAREAVERYVLG